MLKLIVHISLALLATNTFAESIEKISYKFKGKDIETYICKPNSSNYKEAVIYMHGANIRGQIGGTPKRACLRIAKDGYLAVSPLRPPQPEIKPLSNQQLKQLMDFTKRTVRFVEELPNIEKVHMIGYSEGGIGTLRYATATSNLASATVLGASASPKALKKVAKKISTPLLLMVAENDTGSKTSLNHNFVESTKKLADELKANRKTYSYIVLPSYKDDGHKVFWEVGSYWDNIIDFIKKY